MSDTLLIPGTKIDIKLYSQLNTGSSKQNMLEFTSVIYDVGKNKSIDIAMPMQGSPVGERISMIFYCAGKTLYECIGVVSKRKKEEGLYKLEVKLVSELKKIQRREHYRLNISVPIEYYVWPFYEAGSDDRKAVIDSFNFPMPDWNEGMTIDISGGGIKFVSDRHLKKNEKVVVVLRAEETVLQRSYKFLCNIIECYKLPEPAVGFGNRAQFIGLNEDEQEELVKFIFDEERKRIQRKWR